MKSVVNPKVSIIMPSYNAGRYIQHSILSVVNQTFQNWELLVCDDASTDETASVVKNFVNVDKRIHLFTHETNLGASIARRTCLKVASGRFIAFLDADDEWLPNKLEVQLKFMAEKNSPFVLGYCENISEDGKLLSITKTPATVSFWKLLVSNFIPCLTVIYDTNYLGKIEPPIIKKRNDFAFWLEIFRKNKGLKARCYPEVVARYRVNSYGLSANKISGILYFYRCLRRYANLNIPVATLFTCLAIGFKGFKVLSPRVYNLVVTRLL